LGVEEDEEEDQEKKVSRMLDILLRNRKVDTIIVSCNLISQHGIPYASAIASFQFYIFV
jgi:hypothetical protein